MGIIEAICISEKRGTPKKIVSEAVLAVGHGIMGDAHAGNWHRQVSLLRAEAVDEFRSKGFSAAAGEFGENLIVRGIELKTLPIGTRLKAADVVLEITQIGKECHAGCTIAKRTGECIMPREGVFARVLQGGVLKGGEEILVCNEKLALTAAVLTVSDRSYNEEREDLSGPKAAEILTAAGYIVIARDIVPDEQDVIEDKLRSYADKGIALVVTSGGTGFAERDVTPEATLAVCTRQTPGIAETIRAKSMEITPKAMLSRAVAGIIKRTVIVNLPGSPKAVAECLDVVLPVLKHGIDILRGDLTE